MPLDARDRKEIIARRMEAVGQLRARGMTVREIAKTLPTLATPILDENGKAWSHATVGRDLKILHRQWMESAQASIGEHIARQLAEITEVKREARQKGDLNAWLRAFGLEMQLLGTNAPQKVEDWTDRDWKEYAMEHGLSEAEVIEEAERIIGEAKSGRVMASPELTRAHEGEGETESDALGLPE